MSRNIKRCFVLLLLLCIVFSSFSSTAAIGSDLENWEQQKVSEKPQKSEKLKKQEKQEKTYSFNDEIVYYVDPKGGSDFNQGTKTLPFKSIDKARDVIRGINTNMVSNIIVYLREGTYTLAETLKFDSRDSGTNGYNVIYKNYDGEIPVISGGQNVTGWTLYDVENNIWEADVDASLETRQLYVNGIRGIRARSTTVFPVNAVANETGYTISDSSIQWENASDVEFVYKALWYQERCGVSSITVGNPTTITMKQPVWDMCYNQLKFTYGELSKPEYVENAYEFLDEEGEWYLNRQTHKLFYKPRSGENMSTADVVAAKLETLVSCTGDVDNTIHNIHFEGVTFAYATWLQPNSNLGFAQVQADAMLTPYSTSIHLDNRVMMPTNIVFSNAKNIRLERNKFVRLGASGLGFKEGCQDNIISGNEFTDISGSGIQVGGVSYEDCYPSDARKIIMNNEISNNYIHNIAVEYRGCVGVFIGYTDGTRIVHNEICDLPYTAISLGWGYGSTDYADFSYLSDQTDDVARIENNVPSTSKNNIISNNHIYNIMTYMMDGGGIYILGAQPGGIIEGNYIHDVRNEYGAIYLDSGSRYMTVRNNILHDYVRNFITAVISYDNDVEFNYWVNDNGYWMGKTGVVANNYVIGNGNVPLAILDNAGLKDTYADLLPQNSINFALGKTAIGYYNDGTTATMETGNEAYKAIDGDSSTYAMASNQYAWTQEVDLGNIYTIDRVVTKFHQQFYATDYEIQVSLTGGNGNFTTVKTVTGCTGDVSEQAITPVAARYIRIYAVKPDGIGQTGTKMAIADMAVYGSVTFTPAELPAMAPAIVPIRNLAFAQRTAAFNNDGTPAQMQVGAGSDMAVDGDANTFALAENHFAWTQEVDLGGIYNVNRVKITFPQGLYATDYEIQVSKSGANDSFTTVKTVAGCTGGVSEQTFTPALSRYIRIKAVKPDGVNQAGVQMGIAELEVYEYSNYAYKKNVTAYYNSDNSSPQEPEIRNLALGRETAAYFNDGTPADMYTGPEQAVDGNIGTYALAINQFAWTLEVNLGDIYNIDRVKTVFHPSLYATDYEIQVSTTGGNGNFTTVKTVTGCTGGVSEQIFTPVDAQYVRIKAIKPDGPNQTGIEMCIAEFEVYKYSEASNDNDVIYNDQGTAAYYNDGTPAQMQPAAGSEMTIDGDVDTFALAANQFAWTLEVNLGQVYNVSKVKTTFHPVLYATDYEIQVSTTGGTNNFTTVKTVSGCLGGADEQSFTPVEAKYIRIKAIKPDGPNQQGIQMGIAEFQAYDDLNSPITPTKQYSLEDIALVESGYELYKALDGTGATATRLADQYVWTAVFDLGEVISAERFQVGFGKANWPTEWELAFSEDGINWARSQKFTNFNFGGYDKHFNPQLDFRYVLVKGITPDGQNKMCITELAVYGCHRALKMSQMTDNNTNVDKYYYRTISNQEFTFQQGDVISYDVKLCTDNSEIGGIDIMNTDGTLFSSQTWQDQNGITGTPWCDLRDRAFGKWYRREMIVPNSMNGKTSSKWMLAFENDSASTLLQATYDNIVVKRNGNIVFEVYKGGYYYPNVNVIERSNHFITDAPAFRVNRN